MPSFRCEHCRQKVSAREEYAGRRVRCPRCKQAVRVPPVEPVAPVLLQADPEIGTKMEPQSDPVPKPSSAAELEPIRPKGARQDFSSIFSAPLDDLFDSGAGDYSPEELTQVLRPVHPAADASHPEPQSRGSGAPDLGRSPEPSAPPKVFEPSEIIDAPPPMRSSLNSVNEVADLLRGLDNPLQRARLAASSASREAAERRLASASSRATRIVGGISLVVGLAAIGLGCLPVWARYAVPVGSGGLLLAMVGLGLAVGRHSSIGLPVSGAAASAGGLGLALLWAYGMLPLGLARLASTLGNSAPQRISLTSPSSPSTQPSAVRYVPATSPLIVDAVQVRVTSALILRPAVYAGDLASLHTADDRQLQITLELKNLGSGRISYLPWRRDPLDDGSSIALTCGGAALEMEERLSTDPSHPVILAVGALKASKPLNREPIYDVLLFEAPAKLSDDLLLDLPGRNVGQPDTTLHVRIPVAMVRVQAE